MMDRRKLILIFHEGFFHLRKSRTYFEMELVLVWYIGDHMVSIFNINNSTKNLPMDLIIHIPINIKVWWVCQGDEIFVYLNYYLGHV